MLQAKLLLRKCQSIKTPGKLLGTLLLELKLKNKLTNDIDLVRKRFSEATFQPEWWDQSVFLFFVYM